MKVNAFPVEQLRWIGRMLKGLNLDVAAIEKDRKRRFAYICIGLSLPVIVGFTVVDFIEGDLLEAVINILMALIFIVGLVAIKKYSADQWVYRVGVLLLCTVFVYNVLIGSGKGTAIYWLFSFPLVFVFFLGKKEGGIYTAVFILMLCFVMINPLSFDIYPYDLAVSMRFLVSLLLVGLMAYGLEVSREKYFRLMFTEHDKLTVEKGKLEKAMREIKTLSGLIPICSSCKQVRDDKGFWHQVEAFVGDHSNARFSHGICPDCYQRLYPDFLDKVDD